MTIVLVALKDRALGLSQRQRNKERLIYYLIVGIKNTDLKIEILII